MVSLWQSFLEAPGYVEESPWFPNPAICARDIIGTAIKEMYERMPWNGVGTWLAETGTSISQCDYTNYALLLHAAIAAVLLTLLRVFLNWSLFKRIPKWFQLTSESAEKFPESIWKAVFYSYSYAISFYLVVFGKKNLFFNLGHHWDSSAHTTNLRPLMELVYSCQAQLEPTLYSLYVVELGFYLHCIYATTYMETIRRDYYVMMMHHVITLLLLYFSYIVKFHLLGLMLLFTLDSGDIFLELSKTLHYFKNCGNQKTPIIDMLCNACFGIFTFQHVLLRIYWYPTKLLYSAMHVSVTLNPGGPFYLFFNPMVVVLYAMQVYWFKYILRLLWTILILGDELSDNREYKERPEEKVKLKELKKEE